MRRDSAIGSTDQLPVPVHTLAVDIYEGPDGVSLYADLPGASPASVSVTLNPALNALKIRSERTNPQSVLTPSAIERHFGVYERIVNLPSGGLDLDSVQARFDNGVLVVLISRVSQEEMLGLEAGEIHEDQEWHDLADSSNGRYFDKPLLQSPAVSMISNTATVDTDSIPMNSTMHQ
jgi:HSP20 family molecular chaperone IbpA